MIGIKLAIRFCRSACRETCAWFIPGSKPEIWCQEILRWDIQQTTVRLYVVPRSLSDHTPRGILATFPTGPIPSGSPHCQAYGRVHDHLLVPVNAQLDPDLTRQELAAVFPPIEDRNYVFHPAVSLVGFDGGDSLTLSQLIDIPSTEAPDWDAAQPGFYLNQRIQSLRPRIQLDIESSLEEGAEDIAQEASNPSDLDGLPRAPGEGSPHPMVWLLSLAKRVLRWCGVSSAAEQNATQKLRRKPGTADGAEPAVPDATRRSKRNGTLGLRSLERLLHWLEADPDLGLKYALPLGRQGQHRGLVPSRGEIWPRQIDFNMEDLDRHGAAESWFVSLRDYLRLTTIYNRLAMREIRLGRYRRAAYIFAYLLGDLESAAGVLEKGQHYREAAKLFEELLRPWDAARCLENGGLWFEALDIWESLSNFERVAEICAQLGQTERAVEAWRKAGPARTLGKIG